jgi:pimeloyl-ACP methyl ester carboxylesterase/class 3 adenylate cyclase
MKPSIRFAKRSDGVKLAYTQFGEGPVLVYPAPWVTSISFFLDDPVASRFWGKLAKAFTVIHYDKHGCGQSERNRKEFTLDSELFDLETVIEHFRLDEIVLLGASMGGPIAIAYAARHPEVVTNLILYGTYCDGTKVANDDVKSAFSTLVKSAWGLGSKTLANIFLPGADAEQVKALAKFQRESCTSDMAASLLELAYKLDVSELLSNIETPTLVLHREGDKNIPIDRGRELAAEIPDARFQVLKGDAHLPWRGDQDEFIREVLDFLPGESSDILDQNGPTIGDMDPTREVADLVNDASELIEQATIVFSDIVSSTDMVTKLGDAAARDIFRDHDQIIREQLKKNRGRELQNLGDGFMLSFKSASAAIKCARDIQKEISTNLPDMRIRMGINTGDVVIREGGHPFGQAVVLASRVASRANGGEILVSDITRRLAAGSKFSFAEKGDFGPKGFDHKIKIYEVIWRK